MHSFHKMVIVLISICISCMGCTTQQKLLWGLKKHYSDDIYKKEAAKYLVRYLPYHYSYDNSLYLNYCNRMDSIWSSTISIDSMMNLSYLLSKEYEDSLTRINDLNLMTIEDLIWNIDASFDIWKSSPFLRHLSFDDFCEYVLPYKCLDGQPITKWKDEWKDVYLGELPITTQLDCFNINSRKAAEALTYPYRNRFLSGPRNVEGFNIIPILDLKTGFKRPYDSCIDNAELGLLNCRSKGVPVSFDFIPNWAYTSGRHYWNSVYATRRRNENYEPFRIKPGDKHFRDNPMAKVYRKTYRTNSKYLKILKAGYQLPNNLELCSKDVTAEYTRVSDVSVRIPFKFFGQALHLSVFDNSVWVPVDISLGALGRISFKDVGIGVLYAITHNYYGEEIPIVTPFILDLQGKSKTYVPSLSERIDITLTRKFPSLSHIFNSHKYMHGGRLEACNAPSFSKIGLEILFPNDSIFSCSSKITAPAEYRYWRVSPSCSKETDIAELFFYDNNGKEVYPTKSPSELFDRDALTYKAITDEDNVIIDFGEKVSISKVSCIRRGDGNDIIPGDEYALYIWENSNWRLFDKKVASDIKLHFAGVPSSGLYFIRDLSKGEQNRPFIWDVINNKPEWY